MFAMILSVYSTRVNWDPDLTLEDCTLLDMSTRQGSLSQSCAVNTSREEQQLAFSGNFIYKEPDMEALMRKLMSDVWIHARRKAMQQDPRDAYDFSTKITTLLREEYFTLQTKVSAALGAIRDDMKPLKQNITGIFKSLSQSHEALANLAESQRLMMALNELSGTLIARMNALTRCAVKLGQVGESLFLSGEEGQSEQVLAECDTILSSDLDELKSRVLELEQVDRRRLAKSSGAKCGRLFKNNDIDMDVCLSLANHTVCNTTVACGRYMTTSVKAECNNFCFIILSHMTLREVNALQIDYATIGSWLNVVHVQSQFIQQTIAACSRDADALVTISQANAQSLANLAKCANLTAANWNHIVKECVRANRWSVIFIPFYNITTLLNTWSCVRLVSAIIIASTTLVSTFLIVSLLWCLSKIKCCPRQQRLPVYVDRYPRNTQHTNARLERPRHKARNFAVHMAEERSPMHAAAA